MGFESTEHKMVKSEDGSFTAYSTTFEEHYHSTRDGALHESLNKHVIPAFKHHQDKEEITILDICFGLGFNTLATLYYMKKEGIKKRIRIFSPEFDKELINALPEFQYPAIFDPFLEILKSLSETGKYEDDSLYIELYIGDARVYLKSCKEQFDVVYQDAFSPSTNPLLWTTEYFSDIAACMKKDAILTTYSMALKTRMALHNNDFLIYLNEGEGHRDATLASFIELKGYNKVDILHKIACNPDVHALSDADL